ncbi:MAG: methylase [Bacteroidaceae bacterium]|nr:methylase [Bacteroidaceae bacterium]
MAWMRTVCGRLKSDYQYSGSVVYNNFPWPDITDQLRVKLEELAQAVLDIRAQFPESSLADLYDAHGMQPELQAAHRKLDAAVERAYGRRFADDAERVAFLFEKYRELTEGK